jgi:hypothetical protein
MDHLSPRGLYTVSGQPGGDVQWITGLSIASHTLGKRAEFLLECIPGSVGTPLYAYDRFAQRGQWPGRIYRELGAFPCSDMVEVCAVILQGRIQLVEERVIDDADDRLLLVQDADGDARKGEAMHEVCGSICEHARLLIIRRVSRAHGTKIHVPIGSTQNVGASVKGGRVPSTYDSSPMLLGTNVNIVHGANGGARDGRRTTRIEDHTWPKSSPSRVPRQPCPIW